MQSLIGAVMRGELAERGSEEGFLCLGEGDLAALLRAQPCRDAGVGYKVQPCSLIVLDHGKV